MAETKLIQSDLPRSTSRRIISWPDEDDFDITVLLSVSTSLSFDSPSTLICSTLCHMSATLTVHQQCKKNTHFANQNSQGTAMT